MPVDTKKDEERLIDAQDDENNQALNKTFKCFYFVFCCDKIPRLKQLGRERACFTSQFHATDHYSKTFTVAGAWGNGAGYTHIPEQSAMHACPAHLLSYPGP